MRKLVSIFILVLFLSGCSMLRAQRPVILLPEDMIYTLPAGTPVKLQLDGKPLEMTFAKDMKVVDTTTLVKQEEGRKNEVLKRIKVQKSKNDWMKILGGIITLLTGITGWFATKKVKEKK